MVMGERPPGKSSADRDDVDDVHSADVPVVPVPVVLVLADMPGPVEAPATGNVSAPKNGLGRLSPDPDPDPDRGVEPLLRGVDGAAAWLPKVSRTDSCGERRGGGPDGSEIDEVPLSLDEVVEVDNVVGLGSMVAGKVRGGRGRWPVGRLLVGLGGDGDCY
jgi:hypothetical protein